MLHCPPVAQHCRSKKVKTDKVLEPVSNERDADMAKVAQRCIMAALEHSKAPKIVLVEEGQDAQKAPTIELPPQALRAIADLLGLMSQQQPVMLILQKHELTTQEAASFLNVSRPFLIKQIEGGLLKCRKVGRHRRVEFQDLLLFKRKQEVESEDALQRLSNSHRI